ncbi:MAG: histidine kinase [Lachnospiraceae bacterium]|nr:histidine kinase [Lachnospiraceae bacterium]
MNKEIKRHKRLNLFQRLFTGFFSILICICIIITGSFTIYHKQKAEATVYESINQVSLNNAQSISQAIHQVELAIASLNSDNSGLQQKMLLYNNDVRSLISAFEQTIDLLNNYISIALRSFTTKYHVYFFADPSYEMFDKLSVTDIETPSLDGKTWMYSNTKINDTEWYKLAVEFPNQNHWLRLDSEPNTLCLARSLKYLTVNNSTVETITLGVLFIKMDTFWIQEKLDSSDLTADTAFLLVDNSGQILYTSQALIMNDAVTKDLFENTHETFTINEKEYAMNLTSVTSELNLITLIPLSQLHSNYMRILSPFLLLLLISLVAGCVCSYILSHRMTRDILYLARHMRTKKLTLIQPEQALPDEDIQLLYQNYNLLVEKTKESIQKKLEYAEYQKEMELNLLQAQINPHFLCNSLNSVYNLATLHKEDDIAAVLSGLCVYLRYNVSLPNIEVSLQQELDMLEKYISLQNFLCGNCIFFDYSTQTINPAQTKIPKMLLQPLVENCIMHNGGSDFIEISIACTVDENVFRLIVKDNGNEKDVDSINASLNSENAAQNPEQKTHGFGICNVHQRIKMKYGEQYGLHYMLSKEGGIAANINLPASVAVTRPDID